MARECRDTGCLTWARSAASGGYMEGRIRQIHRPRHRQSMSVILCIASSLSEISFASHPKEMENVPERQIK